MESSDQCIGGLDSGRASLPVDNVQSLASKNLDAIPPRYIRGEAESDELLVDESLQIPVIDMKQLVVGLAGYEQEMKMLHLACKHWGFFQLINHGVLDEIEKMKKVTEEFFKLPLEERMLCAQPPNCNEGYGQAFVLSQDQKLDWGDMLYLLPLPMSTRKMNLWPKTPSSFSSNSLSGQIPDFLGKFSNIRYLDLSSNEYSGEIPSALFRNCFNMKFISLSRNKLSGSIPLAIGKCFNLLGVDFSFNNLSGDLPPQICDISGIVYFSVRNNGFAGTVEEQILRCKSLEFLDLASNMFTGSAPFGVLQFSNLTYFNVSSNEFIGMIPNIESCSQKLEILGASSNNFFGEIPGSIMRCSGLNIGYYPNDQI